MQARCALAWLSADAMGRPGMPCVHQQTVANSQPGWKLHGDWLPMFGLQEVLPAPPAGGHLADPRAGAHLVLMTSLLCAAGMRRCWNCGLAWSRGSSGVRWPCLSTAFIRALCRCLEWRRRWVAWLGSFSPAAARTGSWHPTRGLHSCASMPLGQLARLMWQLTAGRYRWPAFDAVQLLYSVCRAGCWCW